MSYGKADEAVLPAEAGPDAKAAHAFVTELRTRIATQSLPYQRGTDDRALSSLYELFAILRNIVKEHRGCEVFADLAINGLNRDLRPFMARWHRLGESGVLASRDGSNDFRIELTKVQADLRELFRELHVMAYGRVTGVEEVPQVWSHGRDGFELELFGELEGEIHSDAEKEAVVNRRGDCDFAKKPKDLSGLALSGGGIRSAAFSLGVVQTLADRGLLGDFDYLSTVSGGGYTGSFVTQTLRGGSGHGSSLVGGANGPDTDPVRNLRRRAKYLSGRRPWDTAKMILANVSGLFLNASSPFALLCLLAMGLSLSADHPAAVPVLGGIAAAGFLGLGVMALVRCIALQCRSGLWNRISGIAQIVSAGGFIGSLLLLAAVALHRQWVPARGIPGFSGLWKRLFDFGDGWATAFAALAGLGTVIVPSLVRFAPVLKQPSMRKLVMKVALVAAGLIVPLLAFGLFLLLSVVATVNGGDPSVPEGLVVLFVLAAGAFISALLLDVNVTAPHFLYRDGLTRSFIGEENGEPAEPDLKILPGKGTPYHLINAVVNLPNSFHEALRERKADFFLFSPAFCGSPSTGYFETTSWRLPSDRQIDLGTAMAISGAAIAPYMGLFQVPTMRSLMVLLNLRLGYWIRNPKRDQEGKVETGTGRPGFVCLLRELFGLGMSENRPWLNLSDGGHLENLGVYELLRRRCKFVVSVDGGADGSDNFGALTTLIRHARIDFGVRIEPILDEMSVDTVTGLSRSHFLLCRIQYPAGENLPGGTGLLLYLRASLTGNEPEMIRKYKKRNPAFPNESTLDQFFDEEQFEVYRLLGVHIAEGLFHPALLADPFEVKKAGNCGPARIADWFKSLASNMLEPEN